MLVVGEVALSLLLLIAAGLFVRSLQSARAIDPGVAVEKLVSAPLSVNLLRYTSAQGREFYRQTVERVRAAARRRGGDGCARAACSVAPAACSACTSKGAGRRTNVPRARAAAPSSDDTRVINANVVDPDFFKTMGIGLLNGRDFGEVGRAERARAS